jgi:hypothetical protein
MVAEHRYSIVKENDRFGVLDEATGKIVAKDISLEAARTRSGKLNLAWRSAQLLADMIADHVDLYGKDGVQNLVLAIGGQGNERRGAFARMAEALNISRKTAKTRRRCRLQIRTLPKKRN